MEETTNFNRKPSLSKEKDVMKYGKRVPSLPGAFSVKGSDSTKNTFGAEEMEETTSFNRKPSLSKEKDVTKYEKRVPSLPGAFSVRGPDSTKNTFGAEEMEETTSFNRKPSLSKEKDVSKYEKRVPSLPGAFSAKGPDSTKNTFGAEEMPETTIFDDEKRKLSARSSTEKRKLSNGSSVETRASSIPGAVSVPGPGSSKSVFSAGEMPETAISDRKIEKGEKKLTEVKPGRIERTTTPGAVSVITSKAINKASVGVEVSYFDRDQEERAMIVHDEREINDTTISEKIKMKKLSMAPPSEDYYTTASEKMKIRLSMAPPSSDPERSVERKISTPGMSNTFSNHSESNFVEVQPDNVAAGPGASQGGRIDDKFDNLRSCEFHNNSIREINQWEAENKISSKPSSRKKVMILAAVILTLMTILAITLSVVLSSNGSNDSCAFADISGVNYFPISWKSCLCNNNLKADIPESHLLKYEYIKARFIEKSILPPDFDNRIEVCDIRNIALLWLAEDAIGRVRDRSESSLTRCFALALLYLSTSNNNPSQWKNKNKNTGWMTLRDECDWAGIRCKDIGDGRMILDTVSIRNNNLTGTIPPEISLLAEEIRYLDLSKNKISGSFPSEIGLLTKLTYLNTYQNTINGALPTEIGLLSELKDLLLKENSISGTIPTEIGLLTYSNIKALHLGSNNLKGTFPSEIGNLESLLDLRVSNNQLTGKIPSSVGSCTSLQYFSISSNEFDGAIPKEIGQLQKLKTLKLDENKLTETIPSTIGMCTSLSKIILGSNKLGGTIPAELGSLQNLEQLNLRVNRFTGTIPTELGNCQNLTRLLLDSNTGLEGAMPSEIGNLSNLKFLYFCATGLTGMIPEQIYSLQAEVHCYEYCSLDTCPAF